jgi:hypothetical protein
MNGFEVVMKQKPRLMAGAFWFPVVTSCMTPLKHYHLTTELTTALHQKSIDSRYPDPLSHIVFYV